MYKFLEDTPVAISCRACGKRLEKKLKWIRKHKVLKCKKCGKKVDLAGQDVKAAVKQVSQAIKTFETALNKLNKKSAKTKKPKSSGQRTHKPAIAAAAPEAAMATTAKEKRSFV